MALGMLSPPPQQTKKRLPAQFRGVRVNAFPATQISDRQRANDCFPLAPRRYTSTDHARARAQAPRRLSHLHGPVRARLTQLQGEAPTGIPDKHRYRARTSSNDESDAAMRSVWSCSACALFLFSALFEQASAAHAGREWDHLHRIAKAQVTAHPVRRDEGTCPSEYTGCPATLSGGCCPSKYACATDSCYATTAGPTTACNKAGYFACAPVNGGGESPAPQWH